MSVVLACLLAGCPSVRPPTNEKARNERQKTCENQSRAFVRPNVDSSSTSPVTLSYSCVPLLLHSHSHSYTSSLIIRIRYIINQLVHLCIHLVSLFVSRCHDGIGRDLGSYLDMFRVHWVLDDRFHLIWCCICVWVRPFFCFHLFSPFGILFQKRGHKFQKLFLLSIVETGR